MENNRLKKAVLRSFVKDGAKVQASSNLINLKQKEIIWINQPKSILKNHLDNNNQENFYISFEKIYQDNKINEIMDLYLSTTNYKEEVYRYIINLFTNFYNLNLNINRFYFEIYHMDEKSYESLIKNKINEHNIIQNEHNYYELENNFAGPFCRIFYDRGMLYKGTPDKLDDSFNNRFIEVFKLNFIEKEVNLGYPREYYNDLLHKAVVGYTSIDTLSMIVNKKNTIIDTEYYQLIKKYIPNTNVLNTPVLEELINNIRNYIYLSIHTEEDHLINESLKSIIKCHLILKIDNKYLENLITKYCHKMSANDEIFNDNINKAYSYINKNYDKYYQNISSLYDKMSALLKKENLKIIDIFNLYINYQEYIKVFVSLLRYFNIEYDIAEFNDLILNSKYVDVVENRMYYQAIDERLLSKLEEVSTYVGDQKLGSRTKVLLLIENGKIVDSIKEKGYVMLQECPFASSIEDTLCDTGYLKNDDFKAEVLNVVKTSKNGNLIYVELLSGKIEKGMSVLTHVSKERRQNLNRNNTSFIITDYVLKNILGHHYQLEKFKIEETLYQLTFRYKGKLSDEKIIEIEKRLNDIIGKNIDVKTEKKPIKDIIKMGYYVPNIYKFNEDTTLVTIDNIVSVFAAPLVKNTNNIERIAVISIESIGKNSYKMTCSTKKSIEVNLKDDCLKYYDQMKQILEDTKRIIDICNRNNLTLKPTYELTINDTPLDSYEDLVSANILLEGIKKEYNELSKKYNQLIISKIKEISNNFKIEYANNISYIITITNNYEISWLKPLAEELIKKMDNGFVLLANISGKNVNFLSITNSENKKIHCGNIVKELSIKCQGKGEGTKLYGVGGGKNNKNLTSLLQDIKFNLYKY